VGIVAANTDSGTVSARIAGLARLAGRAQPAGRADLPHRPIRHVVFAHLNISPAARRVLDSGVTWGNWVMPPLLEVAAVGRASLGVAMVRFSRTE
jgi:hypothetical protein